MSGNEVDYDGRRLVSVELPMSEGRPGEWQLVRRSFPVFGGAEHNYLALEFVPKNGPPEPFGEIHGASYDRETKKYGAMSIGTGDDMFAIHVRPGDPSWGKPPTDKRTILARGDYDSIVQDKWKKAQETGVDFNKRDVVYRYDEQNSNNFARNLIKTLGLEPQSGRWDGDHTDYGAYGFNYYPGQWNVRDVLDPEQAVTRENLGDRLIRSMEERATLRPTP